LNTEVLIGVVVSLIGVVWWDLQRRIACIERRVLDIRVDLVTTRECDAKHMTLVRTMELFESRIRALEEVE